MISMAELETSMQVVCFLSAGVLFANSFILHSHLQEYHWKMYEYCIYAGCSRQQLRELDLISLKHVTIYVLVY